MKFVILTTQRSGSYWLVNTLDNIPTVTCFGELFIGKPSIYKRGKTQIPNFLHERPQLKGPRPVAIFRYLDRVLSTSSTTGFKLMYSQLRSSPELFAYLVARNIPIIHLIRRNILNSILSKLVAKETGQFHYKLGETIPTENPMWVDPAKLVWEIRRTDQRIRMMQLGLSLLRLKHVEAIYEDLVAEKNNFKPIWDFLHVDFIKNPPIWQTVKSRKKAASETILNFSEVSQAVAEAGYAHLLVD